MSEAWDWFCDAGVVVLVVLIVATLAGWPASDFR